MYNWIIENEIAVGGFPSAKDFENMKKDGIRAVISLTDRDFPPDLIPSDMEHRTFSVEEFAAPDPFELREFLLYAAFLKKVRFPFLIHCDNGVSRSPLYATLYLIYTGKTLLDAERIVRSKINVNWSSEQREFLSDFEKHILLYYMSEELDSFYNFNELIKLLRRQCPWDREQTHKSLVPELIEESLELAEAIKRDDFSGIKEELGDVLLQIVLHSVISEEEGKFSISDVMNGIFEKMYRRHPHVFGSSKVKESREVLEKWEEIKKKEKKENRAEGIAKILASLITAFDIQDEARKAGFDFSDITQIEQKIGEELDETVRAIKENKNISEEVGDLLFSVINLARFLNIDPAHALFLSIDKFGKRFNLVKSKSKGMLKDMSDAEKDELWEEAKKEVK